MRLYKLCWNWLAQ